MREIKQAYKQFSIKQIISICACLIFSLMPAKATDITKVNELLKQEGFEDIQTIMVADTLYAAFEDRSFRGTFRGAAAAIKIVEANYPEVNNFEIVLKDYQMPQLIVHASKRGGKWNVSVDRQMEQAMALLQNVMPKASSTGKIDITVFPMVSVINNKLDHLFDYSVRLAPAFATTLWKGTRLTIQPIFPILHNLSDGETKRYIQIGNANVSQQILSTSKWQLSAAAGFFHAERLGVQAKVGYHVRRNLDVYLDAGYTANANYTKKLGFGVTRNSGQINFMAKADYYEPNTKLQIELQGGRFVYGDYGCRLDVTRHFGEFAIGGYGIATGGEYNAGFHFAIPLGGKRQKRDQFVRVRLPEYFSWEYSYVAYFKYWLERMGESYVTQPDANRSAHYWEPAFVQEYIQRMLDGTFQ